MTDTTTMTDTRDTFASLRNLTAARDSLPMDWGRFNALFGEVTDADSLQDLEARAVAATIGACTRPGMTEEQARTVGDLCAMLADAEAEAADIPADDLCALLGELVAADDLPGLELALFKLTPHDGFAYVEKLRALADAAEPNTPCDPEAVRAEKVRALADCPKPGRVIGLELAGVVVDAVEHWHRLKTDTPKQKAVREAFKAARALIDRHGEEDPRAFAAIVHAVNLQNPAFIDEKLKESGIHLPKPDRCTDDGVPLYSLDAVAAALDADPEELLVKARELEAHGLGVLHADTATTHTLQ
ncbi:hypothetical protein [Sphaerotilus sp.]|uniref:hypothetical protein n=1 Tax=Sphaerotilus sp. TaxID=2093942 RepID=UPI0034E23DA3